MYRRYWSFLLGLLLVFSFALVAVSQEYNEAPVLQEKVAAGELPPVDERLPDNPLVLEPLNQIGQYGGTWQRFSTWEEWGHFRMALYGWSPVRWVEDGLGVEPNWIESWESNEDKTSWTFHIREGVKWSDGEPLTVDDFLFWWREMALNPEHSAYVPDWAQAGGEAMQVTKVDDYTMKWDYEDSAPLLIKRLAMWPHGGLPDTVYVAVPEHYLKQFHPDHSDEYKDYETFEEKQEWWHNMDCPVLTEWMPVEEEAGKRLVLERNPYFYAVDPEGNQLPYIDGVNLRFLADQEVFKLKLANGESDMQIRPGLLTLRDVATLKANESKGNFETLMWDSGSGSGPLVYPNYNHPNDEKRALYRNSKFLRALSHAIDRERINKMIYFGTGNPGQCTFSPKAIEYHRTEAGKEIYEEWNNLAVEYDPEGAKALLDEIDVVDQNDDGWREMPSGKELKLRIEVDSEASITYTDSSEMIKDMWREIGLKTIVNPVDGSKIGVMQTEATFDIRDSWELGDGPNHLVFPQWLVPIYSDRWAPLYGRWYNVQGTPEAGTELDKDPRDRTPPRAKPPEGGPVDRLQKLYTKAKSAVSWEERDRLVREMIKIHIEHGPFMIGTAKNYPRIGVVSDAMKNVPRKEDLALGGFVNPWIMSAIGMYKPSTFYLDR